MSDFDVYQSDMPRRGLTQADVELLFSTHVPVREDLASFAVILECLHRTGRFDPSDEVIADFSGVAAEIARAGREAPHVAAKPTAPRRDGLLMRRFAGALGAALFLTGMTGVAMADDAAPGDVLYGLDRAMESIGVGDSGPSERIAEAKALFHRGQIIAAIAHAAEAVEAASELEGREAQGSLLESSMAIDALRRAAERVDVDPVNSDDPAVKNAVAGILDEIANMLEADDVEPPEFGARISEMARDIGRGGNNPSETTDTSPPTPEERGPAAQPSQPSGPPDNGLDHPSGASGGPPADVPGRGRP